MITNDRIENLTERQKDIIKSLINKDLTYDVKYIHKTLTAAGHNLSIAVINVYTKKFVKVVTKRRTYLKSLASQDPILYRATTLYNGARSRTKKKSEKLGKDIPFDITVEWIYDKLKKGTCEISGLSFKIKEYNQDGIWTNVDPRAPSLDRIDSKKHYTKDNVRVICDCLNKLFGPHDDSEIIPIVKRMIEQVDILAVA